MGIDLAHLRRHYASLSDEGLREIDASQLVEAARQCYEEELARRSPGIQRAAAPPPPAQAVKRAEYAEPASFEQAECVCVFNDHPGAMAAQQADSAREALLNAGIPCTVERETAEGERYPEFRVLVPAGQYLHGTSVLDCEIFNPRMEAEWRTHLEIMSDDDLGALNSDIICAGLLDRAERLRVAFEEELERRGL